jgi:threonine/homoserine/homoserine lactone efflux protein
VDEQATDDPVRRALLGLAGSPGRSLAVAVAVLAVLLYSVFISQQLLVVVWLLAVGFLVYLLWRFVRAHERIASAAERLADGGE